MPTDAAYSDCIDMASTTTEGILPNLSPILPNTTLF